jgi:carbon storage regulator
MIGDSIVVTIVDIRGDKVRLGINAPTEIPVHRQEVYEAIQRENLRASRLEPGDTQDVGRLSGRGTTGQPRPPEGPRR